MSAITDAIGRHSTSLLNLIDAGLAAVKANRDTGNRIAQDALSSFIQGTGGITGVGASGDIPQVDLGTSTNVYLHFKLPYLLTENISFRLNFKGYSYGESKIIECDIAGMIINGVFSVVGASGTHTVAGYTSASGNTMVCVLFPTLYFSTVVVTSYCQTDTKKVVRGQLQGRASLSSTIDF